MHVYACVCHIRTFMYVDYFYTHIDVPHESHIWTSRKVSFMCLWQASKSLRQTRMSDWPIKHWSFFTGFNAIELQVLHKQETDLRSQNAQKHAGQPCLQQVGHANWTSRKVSFMCLWQASKSLRQTRMSDWPIKHWSFFTGFNAIKLQVLHKQETDLRSQNAQKHAEQPCLQQVGHANWTSRKVSFMCLWQASNSLRQTRMSDWPIKRWSFFTGFNALRSQNAQKHAGQPCLQQVGHANWTSRKVSFMCLWQASKSLRQTRMSDWPIKHWSFFTGFIAIKLQVLHKQETDLCSQNAQACRTAMFATGRTCKLN